jgi:hypothetical protein
MHCAAVMRIALIHALKHSVAPIEDAFARLWPAPLLANLLDDSLSADLARDGALTPGMTERFLTLARYAKRCGADGILFTCSAFGPCIEACARELAPLPVLKPNEAMIEDALAFVGATGRMSGNMVGPSGRMGGRTGGNTGGGIGGRIGLLATFAPTLDSMPQEFAAVAPAVAPGVIVVPKLAEGALAALDRGDPVGHDRAVADAAMTLRTCYVIALGQFSLARAAPAVAAATGRPVLTTPDSAVNKLKRLLGEG